jgi:hypothetical protein
VTGWSGAELLLDPFPELAANYRLVLPGVAIVLVSYVTHVNWIGEQMVKRSARERLAAPDISLSADLGPGDDPLLFQIHLQSSDAA